MAFNEGDLVFVDYGEIPPCIHARLVGPPIQGDVFVIVTPDYDIYEKELHPRNTDYTAFHPGLGGLGSPLPPGLNPAEVYSFGPI